MEVVKKDLEGVRPLPPPSLAPLAQRGVGNSQLHHLVDRHSADVLGRHERGVPRQDRLEEARTYHGHEALPQRRTSSCLLDASCEPLRMLELMRL